MHVIWIQLKHFSDFRRFLLSYFVHWSCLLPLKTSENFLMFQGYRKRPAACYRCYKLRTYAFTTWSKFYRFVMILDSIQYIRIRSAEKSQCGKCNKNYLLLINDVHSSWDELLNLNNSVPILHKILQTLAIEMFRLYTGLATDILNKLFPLNHLQITT